MKKIRTPTYIRLVGFADENVEARERNRFAGLIKDVGAHVVLCDSQKNPIVATRTGVDAVFGVHLKLLVGSDYAVYQIWASPEDDGYRGDWAEAEAIARGIRISGEDVPLFETEVRICGEPLTASMTEALWGAVDAARSLLRYSALDISMTEAAGTAARYWLSPSRQQGKDAANLSRVRKQRVSEAVDDIARIEVYRHKINGFYKSYPEIHSDLSRIESQVGEQLKSATRGLREAKPFELKDILYKASEKYVEIAAVARALEIDSQSTASNLSNLKSIFRRWDEQPVSHWPLVSARLLTDTDLVPEAYARLARKVESVRVEMTNVTEVVRAKVDLEQQGDILLIQRGLDWLQIFVLTDILFRVGVELLIQEGAPASLPIARDWQPLSILGGAFILGLILTAGVRFGVKRLANR